MRGEDKRDLLQLADDYIEARLQADEKQRLEQWLQAVPEARRVFADFLLDHAALYWRHVACGETTGDVLKLLDVDEVKQADAAVQRPSVAGLLLAVAAFVCLAALVLYGLISVRGSGFRRGGEIAAAPGIAETVARIIYLNGQATGHDGRDLARGDTLSAGEVLRMEKGLVELVFPDTGVHAIASAPLEMKLEGGKFLRLVQGEIKLDVPPQGIGFVVETRERRITDLGTRFVVTARLEESKVLVLEGKVAVSEFEVEDEDGAQRLMGEGEYAVFRMDGEAKYGMRKLKGLPQLYPLQPVTEGLLGVVMGLEGSSDLPPQSRSPEDHIGGRVLPLVRSGFRDESCLDGLSFGEPVRFGGVAGALSRLPEQAGLSGISPQHGWMAWFRGEVVPPQPGRYRFWGYADNHLLVAIDGRPVFEGSRFGSVLQEELGVPRQDHLEFPCLNATTGFASGDWIEVGSEPVRLDILLGEMSNPFTAGLLLVEREGETLDTTFWGQPKWPLFLTESPDSSRAGELRRLSDYLEEQIQGAFSVRPEAVWRVSAQGDAAGMVR